ncbi:MAG: XRE family transcriptional regulator [Bacteroidales bacterium]|jgi:hypothetical protein|nr:XRE family transcriptional regulator [Bacteroidales bacterium]
MTIPIGTIIQEQLHNRERSAAWLAKKLHCDASNFSKKLKKNSIDTELLMRISLALEYNFFAPYFDAVKTELKHHH